MPTPKGQKYVIYSVCPKLFCVYPKEARICHIYGSYPKWAKYAKSLVSDPEWPNIPTYIAPTLKMQKSDFLCFHHLVPIYAFYIVTSLKGKNNQFSL